VGHIREGGRLDRAEGKEKRKGRGENLEI